MKEKPAHSPALASLTEVFAAIDQLFPVHLVLDKELHLLAQGRNIDKIAPELSYGDRFVDHFELISPQVAVTFDGFQNSSEETVVFAFRKKGIKLRGQILSYADKGVCIFVGHLMLENASLLAEHSISLDDFAPFDSMPDFILSQNAQEASLVEIQELVDQLQKTQSRLLASNSALEQFAYAASHDLQSPLRTIVSFAQLLQASNIEQLDNTSHNYLNIIISSTRSMQRLISDLLSFAKVQQTQEHFESVNVSRIIQQITEDLHHDIRMHDATVTYNNLPQIIANETLLRQVFQNLISNAVKFKGKQAPIIRIEADESAKHWTFRVIDNGMGFSKAAATKIFEVFQRAPNAQNHQGTGIGLAICKKSVERHQGNISAHSAPGEGSTFTFTISKNLGKGYC